MSFTCTNTLTFSLRIEDCDQKANRTSGGRFWDCKQITADVCWSTGTTTEQTPDGCGAEISPTYWTSGGVFFHLQDEDLRFPHQTLTLVSSEQRRHVLDFDLAVVSVNVSAFPVAQEHADEAVSICMVSVCSWRAKVGVSVKAKHGGSERWRRKGVHVWEKSLDSCAYLQWWCSESLPVSCHRKLSPQSPAAETWRWGSDCVTSYNHNSPVPQTAPVKSHRTPN